MEPPTCNSDCQGLNLGSNNNVQALAASLLLSLSSLHGPAQPRGRATPAGTRGGAQPHPRRGEPEVDPGPPSAEERIPQQLRSVSELEAGRGGHLEHEKAVLREGDSPEAEPRADRP